MSTSKEVLKRILTQAGAFEAGAKMPQIISNVEKFERHSLITEEEKVLTIDALRTKMMKGIWPWEEVK